MATATLSRLGNSMAVLLPKPLRQQACIDVEDELMDQICCDGAHIGGYPFFTQTDPREYEESYRRFDTVLLQIDTDEEIMWGDSGVANFFIAAEDLAKKDFSRVLYNWDCC